MGTIGAVAFLFLGAVASVEAALVFRPVLRLVRNTGEVVVSYGNESWSGGTRADLPIDIPPGSEVTVLAGRVELEGGGITVRATEGDSFAYNAFPEDERGSLLQIAATGDSTAVEVRIGDAQAVLTRGDAIAVLRSPRGDAKVRVLAGYIDFSLPDGDKYLWAGQMLARWVT